METEAEAITERLTGEYCPACGYELIEVIASGDMFCSNLWPVCEYEKPYVNEIK